MKVITSSLLEGAQTAKGTAVVVDVYRAFTCAPLMFSLGLEKSILVADPAEALAMKAKDPDLILVGEVKGVPVEGFDLGNSPSQILNQPEGWFSGRTAVQRTSAGVQGVLAAIESADEVLLGSFALARAVGQYLKQTRPETVTIVAMGVQLKAPAPEDEWCAQYIAHGLDGRAYDHNRAMRDIIKDQTTQKFLSPDKPEFPAEDPLLCLQPGVHDFALRAAREDGLVVVRKILPSG